MLDPGHMFNAHIAVRKSGLVWNPNGNITVLDAPNASATYAYSVNARGEVSGSFDDTSQGGKRRGFVFRQHKEGR
jgi:hypothetical protein